MIWRTRRAESSAPRTTVSARARLTVVEQHPSEVRLQRAGEATEQGLVGLDRRLEPLDRGRVVAGTLVEVGNHAEA